MDKNFYSYIDPGVVHFMAYPDTMKGEGPILETIEKIAQDDFFNVIEVTHIKDPALRKKVAKILRTSHLDVYYCAQPRQLLMASDLNTADRSRRADAIQLLKDSIDEAVELNVKGLALLSGKNVPGEEKNEALERLIDSLKEVCAYAFSIDKEMSVVLEVFDSTIDKCLLIGPVKDAKYIVETVKVDCNNFGLMVDQSHISLLNETPQEAIQPIKDHLVHVHIANCVLDKNHYAYGDHHPFFGIENGMIDVNEMTHFFKVLLELGYLSGERPKPVSIEVKPGQNESGDIVLANAKRVMRKAWARL